MRTRKEIEDDHKGFLWDEYDFREKTIEILLDIRDLLNKRQ